MIEAFSPQAPPPILAATVWIAMKSEENEDVMIFLLFCGHCTRKCAFRRGGHYSLKRTLFSSEYCLEKTLFMGRHNSLWHQHCPAQTLSSALSALVPLTDQGWTYCMVTRAGASRQLLEVYIGPAFSSSWPNTPVVSMATGTWMTVVKISFRISSKTAVLEIHETVIWSNEIH